MVSDAFLNILCAFNLTLFPFTTDRNNMSGCCNQDCSLEMLRERQRGTLQIVLGINAIMFLVIVAAAFVGNSTALLADSLDNL